MPSINQICYPVLVMSSPIRVVPYAGSLVTVAVLKNWRMRKCNDQTKKVFKKNQKYEYVKKQKQKHTKTGGKCR